jgi:Tfp pilus assembly protein PilE
MIFPKSRATMARSGSTLLELMIGALVVGVVFYTVYSCFTYGFLVTQLNRENLRATQILQEKMEMARLYNWDQVTNNWIPATFSEYFVPSGGSTNGGFTFNGTVTVTNAPITETYSSDLRMLTVKVSWTSGKVLRQRDMTTFISHYGLQNYIY